MRSTTTVDAGPVKPSIVAARRIWIRQRKEDDNAWVAAANLLALMGVTVPRAVVKQAISAHHAYPGLVAVIDVLEDWGVKCEAAHGEVNDLPSIAYPVLAQLRQEGQPRFVVLWEVDAASRRVTWLDPDGGWREDSWDEFGKLWTGVTLLAEAPTRQPSFVLEGSPWRDALARALPAALPMLGIAYVIYAATVDRIPWFAASMMLLYALGLTMSVLAVLHGLGAGLQKLCPAGKTLNCRGVLESPASRLFGWLPVADLGVVYFSIGLLLTAIRTGLPVDYSGDIEWILTFLAWTAVPYAFFAIGYQAFRLKQWCWMCLVVQLTVLTMALSYGWPGRIIGPGHRIMAFGGDVAVVAVGVAGFVMTAAWLTVRPLIVAWMANPALSAMNNKLQNDPVVVENALSRAPLAPPYGELHDLAVGDPGARFQLVVVSNPRCGHCATTHQEVVTLLLPHADDLRVSFRFRVSEHEGSTRTALRHALEHCIAGRMARALECLDAVFAGQDGPTDPSHGAAHAEAESLLNAQFAWSSAAGVEGTPTFFLQGRRLPAHVSVKSIRAFVRRARRDVPDALPVT